MTVVGLHPEELFDKLLDGDITSLERERLRSHLDACEVCRFEYAARLDFQEEALSLSSVGAPPALPLLRTPLPVADESPRMAVRRRRSRLLVWGLAAAALITASGALASALTGRAPWRAVNVMLRTERWGYIARADGSKRMTRGSFTSSRSSGFTDAIFSRTSSAALRPST